MSDDQPGEGGSKPTVPESGADDTGATETTDAQSEDGTTETTDAQSEDGTTERVDADPGGEGTHDPAGVGGRPTEGDASGLSGQPDAGGIPTDWSDVEGSSEASQSGPGSADEPGDGTPVDSETRVDAGTDAGARDDTGVVSDHTQGTRQGPAGSATQSAGDGGAHAGGQSGGQRGPAEKFCSNCGTVIDQQAVVCPACGVEQADAAGQATASRGAGGTAASGGGNGSDPGVAALLSGIGLLIPLATGAGQLYNGDIGKGVLFTVIQLVNVGLFFLLIGFVTYPVVGVIAVYDAYKSADG